MKWLKKRGRDYIIWLLLGLSFNLYFLFLIKTTHVSYLLYLDLLLLVFLTIMEGTAFFDFYKKERRKKALLQENDFISDMFPAQDEPEVFAHDLMILEKRLQEKFDENCDLQDYVAKWCHEFKIPLSAALLMSEKIKDACIRTEIKEQLERMSLQVNMMVQGCRLQSPLFDLKIKQVSLKACVKSSIRNNQFFLIQKGFEMDTAVDEVTVYTDEVWLTYILDQILNNAVKYAKPETETGENRRIRFWTETPPDMIRLFIEDNGEGILECDIRRIFEKGYTGSNDHNGKYKSTGMGLYLADKIAKRLEHELSVESRYGEYTRFCILFQQTKVEN